MSSNHRRPAALAAPPRFDPPVPFAKPMRPPLAAVTRRLETSYDAGILTNGPLVRELEEQAGERLGGVHAVALASCTAGLMLSLRVLDVRGPVVLPGFTFSATAHAVAWNGLEPRFADCSPTTFQLDPDSAESLLDGAGALIGTHVFGAPCAAEELAALGGRSGVPVMFDAAHAFGALRQGKPAGSFGDAEVFSLSPTKIVVAGEGGIVTTGDEAVATALRIGRDYGNPGDYDTRFVGLNARMSELHAALALESLAGIDDHLAARSRLASRYIDQLASIPGLMPQAVPAGDRSTWKDFSVLVDADAFGLARDQLAVALRADGVDTRPYFDPPVHRQQAYAHLPAAHLPVTDQVSANIISLPMFGELADSTVDGIVEVLAAIHDHAEEIRARA